MNLGKPLETTEAGGRSSPGFPIVPAVVKAVAIIRFLNERGGKGGSLPEISEQLGIARSHCHNILRTLVHNQWIAYDSLTRTYTLTSNLAADVSSSLVSRPYLNVIQPLIQQLSDETGLTCVLTEPIGDGSFLVVLTASRPDQFVFNIAVGFRFPTGSPPHIKAALAWLPVDTREAMLQQWKPVRYTLSTITTVEAMREELTATRERGYARSVGEFTEGFVTLLLPVFDRSGEVFMILQLAGVTDLVGPREAEVVRALQRCVSRIHRAIDGRPPIDFPTIVGS